MDFWSDSSVLRILETAAVVLGLFAVYLIVIMITNRSTRRLGESLDRHRASPPRPTDVPPVAGSRDKGESR